MLINACGTYGNAEGIYSFQNSPTLLLVIKQRGHFPQHADRAFRILIQYVVNGIDHVLGGRLVVLELSYS